MAGGTLVYNFKLECWNIHLREYGYGGQVGMME
jgi:hypothetical protein